MAGRTKKYVIKLTEDEHAELKRRADAQGISLATVFREGAKSYLATPVAARETQAATASALSSIEQARSVLKSLTKEE